MTPTSWNSGTSIRSIRAPSRASVASARSKVFATSRIEIIERHRRRHRQPHALDRPRLQRPHRLIGKHGVEHRAAGDAARQRPETVERKRQRHAAIERHAALRRLEADDAVEGRGNPAGAAGIGAERAIGHAIGDRHRCARGRAAGHMADAAVPGALRRAVMRIDTDAGIGEFGHVGAADHDKTGPAQPRHHGCIGFRRRRILQRTRAGAGHLSLDVEQILDRDRNTGKGRWRCLRMAQTVHGVGGANCGIPVDMNEGALALARGIGDFGEAFLDQLAGGRWRRNRDRRPGRRVSAYSAFLFHRFCWRYLWSGAGAMSRSSSAELSDLPCASSASDRVTPPPSAWSITKFSADRLGSS